MMHHDSCPLCNSPDINLFVTCSDHLVSGGDFGLYRCGNCSFLVTNDQPSESDSARYYESEDYISHSDSKKTLFDRTYQAVRSYMLKRKRNLVMKSAGLSTGKILDIGSGTGHFLAVMKASGWHTAGIEVSEKARKYASEYLYVDTVSPENISQFPDNYFDCITLWHVLEHFYDPFGYMAEIKRLLKPEGILILALPNCSSSDSKHYGKYWAAFDVPRHLWHFDPFTLHSFAGKTGFRNILTKRLPFDVFYIAILSEKHKGSKFPSATGLVKGLFFAAWSLLSKKSSSSLVYLLQPEKGN
jgi:2-polyprenyl-3-methyl-5-hydroxy-6-metoxy-1,4-benzoquinol methylase